MIRKAVTRAHSDYFTACGFIPAPCTASTNQRRRDGKDLYCVNCLP